MGRQPGNARQPIRRRITLPPLHPTQHAIALDPARFRVLVCGRRWGKTRLSVAEAIKAAHGGEPVWWIAPDYNRASVGERLIARLARQLSGVQLYKADKRWEFPGGGWIQVRTAKDPDALRGEGIGLAVLDEAAYMRPEAWYEAVRPALSDRQGRALFISTPAGKNWFWRLYGLGMGGELGFRSWQLPTGDNPFIARDEIEAARRELSDDSFRQEYLAEFLAYRGLVYTDFSERVHVARREGALGRYVVGVDWGYANPGVMLVFGVDADGRMWLVEEHYQDRRLIDEWALQAKDIHQRYRPEAFVCDPSEPDYIRKLVEAGAPAVMADNRVLPGIDQVKTRLRVGGDGRARLFVDPSAQNTIREFGLYQWATQGAGLRDAPMKVHDHALDALRYAVMAVDNVAPQLTVTTRQLW